MAALEQLSVEVIARTTDDAAVRLRFGARNLSWLRVLIVLTLPVLFGALIGLAVTSSFLRAAIATANFVAAVVIWISLRGHDRQHATAITIAYILAQTSLFAVYAAGSAGLIALTSILPLMLIGFRMRIGEALLMHGGIVAIVIAAAIVAPPPERDSRAAIIGSTLTLNGIAAAFEFYLSRRMSREIVADFTERRVQAREQLRMRDELRYAREIQLSMLPDAPPALDWLDVAGLSHPATEVGGDYYDYFPVGDRLAIVCGDVAGHGLASGIALAAIRAGFTLLRDALVDPAAVLQRMHEMVAQTSRRRMLVACSVLLLDRDQRRATIAVAGFPPLIVRRADGTVERFDLFASPLGVRLPLVIAADRTPFAPGDFFILHSDGVYESRNASGESYGIERIEEIVRATNAGTAAELRDAIANDLVRFRGPAPQDDDVTIGVARILGVRRPAATLSRSENGGEPPQSEG